MIETLREAVTRRLVKRAGPVHPARWAVLLHGVRIGDLQGRDWRSSRAGISLGLPTSMGRRLICRAKCPAAERWRVTRFFLEAFLVGPVEGGQ